MINTSAFAKTLNKKPVAVFGLGLSGLSVVRALVAAKVPVIAWDDNPGQRAQAQAAGAELRDLVQSGLEGCACLVLAPGIPLHRPVPHPVVLQAQAAGIEIIGDLEIFHRSHHDRTVIGITGTNGKSTTTALIGHVLKEGGIKNAVGGNIGKAALDLMPPPKDGVVVLEISSYQMDLCPTFRPHTSILLNVTPDHIDRHGSLDSYAASKARIFEGPGVAICGIDDAPSKAICEAVKAKGQRKVLPISVGQKAGGGVYVLNGRIIDDIEGYADDVGEAGNFIHLPGVHNQQNICAAYAAARVQGLRPDVILEATKTYPGLPHRQFLVRTINGVAYVNDSKATNADAAAKALTCYQNIYWIAGGRPKEGGLNGLESYMPRVKRAFLIGEAMKDFGAWLDKLGVIHSDCRTLDVAVLDAHRTAQAARGEPGGTGTVLLSPACASWDQFRNFEHRGEAFTALVSALDEDIAA